MDYGNACNFLHTKSFLKESRKKGKTSSRLGLFLSGPAQGSLRVVDSWCNTKGLSVNPEKTEVLLFITKRKTEGVKV